VASRTLSIRYTGDPRGALGAVKSIESAHASLANKVRLAGGALSSAGRKLTTSLTLPILGAGVAAVKLASDAEETRNRVNVVFGDMADQVLSWSKTTIESMGAASATSQDVAATFGLLFKSAGLAGKALGDMSIDFAQLAGDASSFFNVPIQEALDRIRSGLTGEAEPMRKFGVFLNEAAVQAEAARLGIAKVGQELTDQEKIMARASLITKGMSDAQGDFERTSSSAANQIRQTVERLKEMGAEIGADLIPVAQDLLAVVQGWIESFRKLTPEQRQQVIKWAAIAAAAGPLLRIFGGLLNISGALIGFFAKLGGVLLGTSKAAAAAAATTRASGAAAAPAAAAAGGLATAVGGLAVALVGVTAVHFVNEMNKTKEAARGAANAVMQGTISIAEGAEIMESKVTGAFKRLDLAGIAGALFGVQEFGNRLKQGAEEVERFRERVDTLPGVLTPVRDGMIDNAIAAGNFKEAMRLLKLFMAAFVEDVKGQQRGMKELSTEFDRNAATTETWRRNQREATKGVRDAAEANARLGADVRRLGDYITKLPKQHKTNVEANTDPARNAIEAFIRQITQRTYTLTFTAQREGPSVTATQHGFHGVVSSPRLFLAGEAGSERVDITPRGAAAPAGSAGSAGTSTFHVIEGFVDTPWGPAEMRIVAEEVVARRTRASARALRGLRPI
jgi:hypothetical protein